MTMMWKCVRVRAVQPQGEATRKDVTVRAFVRIRVSE